MRRALPFLIIAMFLAALAVSLVPSGHAATSGCAVCPNLGLDLVGGLRGEYQIVPAAEHPIPITKEILEETRSIIEKRVNASGVSEPVVQTVGSDRVTVELPGADNPDQIRKLIGVTGLLAFVGVPPSFANLIQDDAPLPAGMDKTPLFTGEHISAARPGVTSANQLAVDLELDETGARLFDDYAKVHQGERFAIVLDGKVVSAPTINASQFNGRAQISGNFTTQSMNDLVTVLKFGSLKAEIHEASFAKLSASLGLSFLAQTVLAGFLGIMLVFLFMLIHYRLPGVVACIALVFYTVINFALYKLVGVTLTLAGIAGFVLSVGMAVDANILIFERTKEELRAGKTLAAAIEAGFGRAWNSIFDSNVSTLMTASILWYFGTSTVKGFALVLIIGVLTSMFTAITLSRMMLRWVVRQQWARRADFFGVSEEEFLVAQPRSRGREANARV